ncbi:hypothetical protein C8Q76DRAFT_220397 [Earliella scabrosa]|nr:hypothetical protein C8Q76DRAFT_220397 [Earliella scabrosa]
MSVQSEFPNEFELDDSDPTIDFQGSWRQSISSSSFNGTLTSTSEPGGSFSFQYYGGPVTIYSTEVTDAVQYRIVIDGGDPSVVNLAPADPPDDVLFRTVNSLGTHTVEVTNLGSSLAVDHIHFRNADTADISVTSSPTPLPPPSSKATSSTRSSSTSSQSNESATRSSSSRDGSEPTISNSQVTTSVSLTTSGSSSSTTSTQNHDLSLRGPAAIGMIVGASVAVFLLSCVVALLWFCVRRRKQEEANETRRPHSFDTRLERGFRDDRPLTREVASWRWSSLGDEDRDHDTVQSRTTSQSVATVGEAVAVPFSPDSPAEKPENSMTYVAIDDSRRAGREYIRRSQDPPPLTHRSPPDIDVQTLSSHSTLPPPYSPGPS